jgi:hypothetical protein
MKTRACKAPKCGGRHWTVNYNISYILHYTHAHTHTHTDCTHTHTHTQTHTRSLATRFSFSLSSCQFPIQDFGFRVLGNTFHSVCAGETKLARLRWGERERERGGGGGRGRAERGREGGREGGCEGVEFRLRFKEERLERVENVLSHTTK